MDSGGVEQLLNQRAEGGWQLKSLTATQVKGRIGPRRHRGPAGRVRAPYCGRVTPS